MRIMRIHTDPSTRPPRAFPAVIAVLLPFILWMTAFAVQPSHAQTPEDDLVLPMPGGQTMEFRPVALGTGPQPFANRRLLVGDRAAGGFKEYPTVLYIGGAFLSPAENPVDWVFYMGKKEVTRQQWSAIMHPETPSTDLEPVNSISWFDVQDFIHRYNQWLYQEALDQLPRLDQYPGFLRLPTEAEWEFAARGGSVVTEAEFDRRHPYGRNLLKHEWFSGPRSSHDKLKKAGILKPNPLGLHDMLGNVCEMTLSAYQVEYIQGRTGGFVVRGGHFRTPENQIRSSLRTEQPYYKPDGTPSAQAEMGFRLVIASPVFAGRETTNALTEQWEDYRKDRPTPGSAQQSTDPTSVRTGSSLKDAEDSLSRIETGIAQAKEVPEDVLTSLGLLKASFGDVQALILKAEKDSAAAWARMASFTAWFLRNELLKLPASERVLDISRQTGKSADIAIYEKRHANLQANIRDATAQYGVILNELIRLQPETVAAGFQQYEQYLIGLGLVEQIKMNQTAIRQYEEFRESKRLNMDEWVEALKTLQ